jgi:hypothetical protein
MMMHGLANVKCLLFVCVEDTEQAAENQLLCLIAERSAKAPDVSMLPWLL